jgi:hypothetical protein
MWDPRSIYLFSFLEITLRELQIYYGVLSLMKGWVCNLQLFLGLTSSLPGVRVLWESRPYFTGSNFRPAQPEGPSSYICFPHRQGSTVILTFYGIERDAFQ